MAAGTGVGVADVAVDLEDAEALVGAGVVKMRGPWGRVRAQVRVLGLMRKHFYELPRMPSSEELTERYKGCYILVTSAADPQLFKVVSGAMVEVPISNWKIFHEELASMKAEGVEHSTATIRDRLIAESNDEAKHAIGLALRLAIRKSQFENKVSDLSPLSSEVDNRAIFEDLNKTLDSLGESFVMSQKTADALLEFAGPKLMILAADGELKDVDNPYKIHAESLLLRLKGLNERNRILINNAVCRAAAHTINVTEQMIREIAAQLSNPADRTCAALNIGGTLNLLDEIGKRVDKAFLAFLATDRSQFGEPKEDALIAELGPILIRYYFDLERCKEDSPEYLVARDVIMVLGAILFHDASLKERLSCLQCSPDEDITSPLYDARLYCSMALWDFKNHEVGHYLKAISDPEFVHPEILAKRALSSALAKATLSSTVDEDDTPDLSAGDASAVVAPPTVPGAAPASRGLGARTVTTIGGGAVPVTASAGDASLAAPFAAAAGAAAVLCKGHLQRSTGSRCLPTDD